MVVELGTLYMSQKRTRVLRSLLVPLHRGWIVGGKLFNGLLNLPVEEMIRRIGSRFDLARDLTPPREANGSREPAERTNHVLNRIFTSGVIRREQNTDVLDDVYLTPSSTTGTDVMFSRIHSLYLQRQSHLRRAARLTSLSSALSSTERMVEAYFRGNPTGRNQEQAPAVVGDRDSFSSIAAVINSEIQMDTTVETDFVVSHSASSRRRNDVLRVSDVDSGDSRAHRRRRLN